MLLSEAWPLYQADKEFLDYSKHTLKAYALYHRLFIKWIGDRELNEVTYFDMKRYLSELSKRLKPNSLVTRIRHLKSFFRWAHEEGYVDRNEASKLKEPKLPPPRPKPLTMYEIESLRDACEIPLERSIIELMYATGCRIGEVVKINKADIDWEMRTIPINGKGNKDRIVYFDLKCEIWLNKYLETRNDNCEALFVTERRHEDGQPRRMSIAQMRYVIKRVAKRAGLERSIFPHAVRHSFAMNLLENGAPIEAIQDFLGHSDPRHTEVYAQLTTEMKREIYKKYHR